jgi:hypothetical protein
LRLAAPEVGPTYPLRVTYIVEDVLCRGMRNIGGDTDVYR